MLNSSILESYDIWQATRGYSVNTRRRRTSSLGAFARYIAPVQLVVATPEMIEEWIATHNGASTRHAYLSDVSAFFAWAVRRDLLPASPAARVEGVRVPKTVPRPVPANLIPGIIACAPDYDLRLMIALAAYAGLRVAEIAALTAEDVAVGVVQPHLLVRAGKGGKDRVVGLHPALIKVLAGSRKRSGRLIPHSAEWVGKSVAQHLRVGCGIDATAHKLRHTFATEFARVVNGNVIAVSRVLGHESIETSMRYIGLDSSRDSRDIAQMYPPTAAAAG